MNRKNSGGFTILETLIAVAIGAIAIAGVVTMIEQVSQSQSTQKYGYEANNLAEEIRTTLGSNAACLTSFKGIIPSSYQAGILNFPGPIFNEGGAVTYQIGNTYGDRAVNLHAMSVGVYLPASQYGGVLRERKFFCVNQQVT